MSTDPTQPLRPSSANSAETDPDATTAKTPAFDPRAGGDAATPWADVVTELEEVYARICARRL